jgi:hypothetical protein
MKINFTVKYKKKIDGLLGQVLPIGRLAQHLCINNWRGEVI